MSASAMDMKARLERWPLFAQPSNRSESVLKDARLVNAYAEKDANTGEYQVERRIGTSFGFTVALGTKGQGIYPWNATIGGSIGSYNIFNSGTNTYLYKDNTAIGGAFGGNGSYGLSQFAETQGATRYLGFSNYQSIRYTDGTSLFTPSTPPLNIGNIIGLAYLDGVLYCVDTHCNVFGSNIDDPSTWQPLNIVVSRAVSGVGVGVAQQLNFVIVLKSNSMEVLYDNDNPPPGSALSPAPGATTNFGCTSKDTIQTIDNIVFYVTSNKTASPQVIRIDNLVPTIVSTPAIERLLDPAVGGTWLSWCFKHGGHRFYGVTSVTVNLTMVYDIDQGLWYQWTDSQGNYFPYAGTSISAAYIHELQGANNGTVYAFNTDNVYPTDNGTVVPVDIYTPNTDFGTRRQKVLHRMYFRGDQVPGSILQIQHSDDDYQSWSRYRYRSLDRKFPYIDDEGTFVKRAYHFRHASPTPFRLRTADLQMSLGTI